MNIRSTAGLPVEVASAASAAAVIIAALAIAGPAAADTAGLKDTRGDMAGHGADIHRVKVVNEKAVRITVRHADLVRSYESGAGIKVYIDTDRTAPLQRPYVMKLSYGKDVTRIRLSRKALDFPQDVRVTVKTGGELDGHQVTDWLKGTREFTPWVQHG